MSKRFRITASEGIFVTLEFNGDEVNIIASYSTNSTTVKPVQVKEDVESVPPEFQRGKTTELSDEQILAICEEYKTSSLSALAKKYHVHWKRIRSALEENGITIRKLGKPEATNKSVIDNRISKVASRTGYPTMLSEAQIASICEEYATTSIRDLARKYRISERRLYSILNENDVQIRKHGQHIGVNEKTSMETYNLEKVDSIIDKRDVSQLRMLYHAIKKVNDISTEELLKNHKFPVEFLEFATSEFELFTQKFILKMYNMGYSIEAISTRIKMPANQIRQLIPDSIIRSRGDKSHSVLTGERLKDTEKEAIKKCFSNGESINDLADRFGVSIQTIKRYA